MFIHVQSQNIENSSPNLQAKTDKEAQIEMSHENVKTDQIIFETEPVCVCVREKLKRKKDGLKLDENRFEESKLVSNCYQ